MRKDHTDWSVDQINTMYRLPAYVEVMNGMLQQVKLVARGFRTVKNFVALAYLRRAWLTARRPRKHVQVNKR